MHLTSFVLIGILLASMGLFNGRFFFFDPRTLPNHAVRGVSLFFFVFAVFAIGAQYWVLRRIVREFTYDGTTLRYRTLGSPEMQTRTASQLTQIKDWKGRGGPVGYRLYFRDAPKAYLDLTVPNAALLVEQLKQERRP